MITKPGVFDYFRSLNDPKYKENQLKYKVLDFVASEIKKLLTSDLGSDPTILNDAELRSKKFISLPQYVMPYVDGYELRCVPRLELTNVIVIEFFLEPIEKPSPKEDKNDNGPKFTAMGSNQGRPASCFFKDNDAEVLGGWLISLNEVLHAGRQESLMEMITQCGYRLSYDLSPERLTVVLS